MNVGGLRIDEGVGSEGDKTVVWDVEEIEYEEEGLVVFDGGSYSRGPYQLGAPISRLKSYNVRKPYAPRIRFQSLCIHCPGC